jgi:hypothetical protein
MGGRGIMEHDDILDLTEQLKKVTDQKNNNYYYFSEMMKDMAETIVSLESENCMLKFQNEALTGGQK